ncbi:hypothetical protein STENM223S_06875 [Streptomyces tendae]
MPMKPSTAADLPPRFGRLRHAISRSPVGRGWRRSKGIELGSRSLGFAALGLLTLVPLLIIVSSADPEHGRGFAQWLGVFLSATTTLRPTPLAGGVVASLSAVLFLWWSQHLLLGGRIRWRALLPGAVATVIGLLGLRVFSSVVFSPLIASNAVTYGLVGTVLVIQSWLVGVGVVVFGGALAGRLLHEELLRLTPPRKRRR